MTVAKQVIRLGQPFPTLRGLTLEHQAVAIPAETPADLTLVLLGFTHVAGQQMEPWASRFKRSFSNASYDYYKIAMVGTLPDYELEVLTRVMARGIPADEWRHVLAVQEDLALWQRRCRAKLETDAYLFLLDRTGQVRWKGAGAFRESAFKRLERIGRALID